jgi:hypothetical protein
VVLLVIVSHGLRLVARLCVLVALCCWALAAVVDPRPPEMDR